MAYRRTENVSRKLAARQETILTSAQAAAAEGGMAALQMAPVARRAAVAAGTVYRYFPGKTDLVAAMAARHAAQEIAAIRKAAEAAPGPLSALAVALVTFAARMLTARRLASALLAEPVEPDIEVARAVFRETLAQEFASRILSAAERAQLPPLEADRAAAATIGLLIDGLIGPLAPPVGEDAAQIHAAVQTMTLMALRALGVVDARARGLVVQAPMPRAASEGTTP